jgi:hypothetical protein
LDALRIVVDCPSDEDQALRSLTNLSRFDGEGVCPPFPEMSFLAAAGALGAVDFAGFEDETLEFGDTSLADGIVAGLRLMGLVLKVHPQECVAAEGGIGRFLEWGAATFGK